MSLQHDVRESRDRMKEGKISRKDFLEQSEKKTSETKKPKKLKRKK